MTIMRLIAIKFLNRLTALIHTYAVIPHTALLSHSKLPQGKFLHRDSPSNIKSPLFSKKYDSFNFHSLKYKLNECFYAGKITPPFPQITPIIFFSSTFFIYVCVFCGECGCICMITICMADNQRVIADC